jgi:predicted transposase/invertase (TIGR01784 family)
MSRCTTIYLERPSRIIIPVVFYHGHGKWNLKRSFSESFDVPHYFRKHTINFEYFLYDTKEFDLSQGDRFSNNVFLMSVLSLMKQYGKLDAEKFRTVVRYMKSSGMDWKDDQTLVLIRYFVMTNEVDKDKVMTIITEEFGPDAEEMMPSLGKKIYNEGREEGLQVGIEKGAFAKAVETCKKALKKGFDINTIIELTGLPVEKIKEIQKTLQTD